METWGLAIDWIGNDYGDWVVRTVQEACRRAGRSVVVFTLGSLTYTMDEAPLAGHLRPVFDHPRVDRWLLAAGQMVRSGGDRKLASILARGSRRPMLTLGASIAGVPSWSVDHGQAFRSLLDHLWSIHGFRRFAFVGGPVDNPVASQRRRWLSEFLTSRGLSLEPELEFAGDFTLSSGRQAAVSLKTLRASWDVVVVANDSMACGVREVLGLEAPVTGFDNHPSAAALGITTIDCELEEELLSALDALAQLAKGQTALAPGSRRLGRLVVRSSCGCAVPTTPDSPAPGDSGAASPRRVGALFETILEAADMAELSDGLNRALPSEDIRYWRILPPSPTTPTERVPLEFWPDTGPPERVELVVHTLFRDEELYGYLMHDLSNRNYTLSEWIRINVSVTLQGWHRRSGNSQVQKLLQVEIDRFSRRQKDIEAVINELPIWIVEVDRRWQIKYTNAAWKTLLGRPASERTVGSFLPTIEAADRDRVEARLKTALSVQAVVGVDFSFVNRMGDPLPVVGTVHYLAEGHASPLSTLFGSLHGGIGLRLVGLNLTPLIEGILQPDRLILKHFSFSPREQELLHWVAEGFDAQQAAQQMEISPSTVRVMLHQLYSKTGVSRKAELLELLADYNSLSPRPQSLTQVLLSRLRR